MSKIDSVFAKTERIEGLKKRSKSLIQSLSRSISGLVTATLNEASSLSRNVSNSAFSSVGETRYRLQAARRAIASLLRVWGEFAFEMDRKMRSFDRSDSEFLSHLLAETKHQLVTGERFANTSDARIAEMNRFMQTVSSEEAETDTLLNNLSSELKQSLNEVNAFGADERRLVEIELQKLSDASRLGASESLKSVQDELEKFENTLITGAQD
jgi:hypothetical protein